MESPTLDELLAKKAEQTKKEGSFIEKRGKELEKIKIECDLPERGNLYYPACGSDYSPSLAFPNWEIVYLDPFINKTGFEGKGGNVRPLAGDLTKPPFSNDVVFDVVMVVSPGVHFEPSEVISHSTRNLKSGGFLVCDNWHGTSGYILKNLGNTFEPVELKTPGELSAYRKLGSQTSKS